MPRQLTWFMAKLAILGVPQKQALQTAQDVQDEMAMRPHLRNPRAFWDPDSCRLIVQVESENVEAMPMAEQMGEELLEILSAVLTDFEEVWVEILDAQPI